MKKQKMFLYIIAMFTSLNALAVKPVLEGKTNKSKDELVDAIYNGTGVSGDLKLYQNEIVKIIAIQGRNQGWYNKVPDEVRQKFLFD